MVKRLSTRLAALRPRIAGDGAPWRLAAIGSAVAALVAWLVVSAASGPRLDYQIGDVVRSEVVASEPVAVVDPEGTERSRAEAAAQVPTIFDFDPQRHKAVVGQLADSLAGLRERYDAAAAADTPPSPATFAAASLGDFPLGDEELLGLFARYRFAPDLVSRTIAILDARLGGYIVGDDQPAASQLRVHNTETGEVYPVFFREVTRLSDAKARLRSDLLEMDGVPSEDRRRLGAALEPLVSVTLAPNPTRTEQARQSARDAIPEARDEYGVGQIVAYRNQIVDARLARALGELGVRHGAPNRLARWTGTLLFVLVFFYACWRFTGGGLRSKLSRGRAFVFVALILLLQITLVRLGVEVSERFGTLATTADPGAQFLFAVPFAVAPLVIALLVDGSFALVVGFGAVPLIALMTAGQPGGGAAMAVYAAISAAAAVRAGLPYHARLVVAFAAVFVAIANTAGVVAVTLIATDPPAPVRVHLANVGAAALGAFLTAAVSALVLPVFEWGFDIMSDVRLLELANADRKLLRELAIRAPGTHQHSYVMSSIATEAAKAIGANPLLVRIGAYYHDIGKLHAPHMFIENQQGGPNPHDQLEPAESARQIIRHVSWGVERAREEGLPPQVCELITGHHGTRTLHFFLEKAKRLAPPGTTVDESEFRYPGPKPQTRESAILMLADGAEAAVRSLDEQTRDRVEAIVRKIADTVLGDDQLDECGMTLEEVSRVREAIIEALMNLYHKRISYPGFNPPPASRAVASPVRR
jgi:putative nucleotidyltransferase with HDIG domain